MGDIRKHTAHGQEGAAKAQMPATQAAPPTLMKERAVEHEYPALKRMWLRKTRRLIRAGRRFHFAGPLGGELTAQGLILGLHRLRVSGQGFVVVSCCSCGAGVAFNLNLQERPLGLQSQ